LPEATHLPDYDGNSAYDRFRPGQDKCPFPEIRTLFRGTSNDDLGLSRWQCWLNVLARRWFDDCLIESMPNLLLAPEDDDSDLPLDHNLGTSPRKNALTSEALKRAERFRLHFDPRKPGFGLVSLWPGADQALGMEGTIAIKLPSLGKVREE
jgi:hypothetical protein